MSETKKSEPRLGFVFPTIPEAPVIVVPLAPPSGRPTIPRNVYPPRDKPAKIRDRSRQLRQAMGKHRKSLLEAAERSRVRRLKAFRLAKAAPWALGFQIGWELGDYLFPNGFYDFIEAPSGGIDYTIPAGWTNSGFGCVTGGGGGEYWRWEAQPQSNPYSTPGYHYCGMPGQLADKDQHVMTVGYTVAGPGNFIRASFGRGVGLGTYSIDGLSENVSPREVWVYIDDGLPSEDIPMPQLITTGVSVKAPLAGRFPSEHPETFPMQWPMEMPYPQKFAEAVPAPRTQGEGKHSRPGQRPVPRMPIAPVPVVVGPPPPPGSQPPDQVIDIPPPPPPPSFGRPNATGRSVRYRTRPNRGRQRPKPNEKEKKLTVHSKKGTSIAWIGLNLATEVFDFIDALFNGLPDEVIKETRATYDYGARGGGNADPYAKARAIWDHFDEMDWSKAINAFINNQVEDMVVGTLGVIAGSANKAGNLVTGGGGAVSGRPQGFLADAEQKRLDWEHELAMDAWRDRGSPPDEKPVKGRPGSIAIPTLEFNQETQRWEVTIPWTKMGFDGDWTFT